MLVNCIEVENLQRVDFKSAQILPGDETSPFYLDVTYEFENICGIFELHLPKVRMDMFFKNDRLPNIKREKGDPACDCCCGGYSPIILMHSSFHLPTFIDSSHPSGLGLFFKSCTK